MTNPKGETELLELADELADAVEKVIFAPSDKPLEDDLRDRLSLRMALTFYREASTRPQTGRER